MTASERVAETRAHLSPIGRGFDRRTTMRSMDRRTFLELAGIAGASTLLTEALPSVARADKPINFSGWVFKPDTVKDYVSFYNQQSPGQAKYEAMPRAQSHPTMEP